jgi:hypothetical protein
VKDAWVFSKIISSEYFVTLIVSIVGILTVSGVISVGDPNTTGNELAKLLAGILTLVSNVIYTYSRTEIKKSQLPQG